VALKYLDKYSFELIVSPSRYWYTEPLIDLLNLELKTPSKDIAPAFLKKKFKATGEIFYFHVVRGVQFCSTKGQTVISVIESKSMVDVASYDLHAISYEYSFDDVSVLQSIMPRFDLNVPSNLILDEMDLAYPAPFFDSFLSTYFVHCPRKNEALDAGIILGDNLACKKFISEIEQADRFDPDFFYKFYRNVCSLWKLAFNIG
jgi:hypothetical protein